VQSQGTTNRSRIPTDPFAVDLMDVVEEQFLGGVVSAHFAGDHDVKKDLLAGIERIARRVEPHEDRRHRVPADLPRIPGQGAKGAAVVGVCVGL
jgi:hypothetical protein